MTRPSLEAELAAERAHRRRVAAERSGEAAVEIEGRERRASTHTSSRDVRASRLRRVFECAVALVEEHRDRNR